MKTLYVKNIIAVLFLALACVACNKNEEDEIEPVDVETANIVFTVILRASPSYPSIFPFNFSLRGSGTAVIDWGDGLANDTIEMPSFIKTNIREYNSADPRTVRIYCEDIDYFAISEDFTSFDVSRADSLRSLVCHGSQLTKLDVSKNTKLIALSCSYTQLTQLDLSKNTELGQLLCGGTQITSLDLSKNIKLETLHCVESQLKSLVLSANHNNLRYLQLWGCQLTAEAFDILFNTLPFFTEQSWPLSRDGYLYIGNNPGTDSCNISIAEEKGWKIDKITFWK